MTGPAHSRIAGIARPVVFIVCVGPNTITDWRGSAASSARPAVPTVRRPGVACADEQASEIASRRPARAVSTLLASDRRMR